MKISPHGSSAEPQSLRLSDPSAGPAVPIVPFGSRKGTRMVNTPRKQKYLPSNNPPTPPIHIRKPCLNQYLTKSFTASLLPSWLCSFVSSVRILNVLFRGYDFFALITVLVRFWTEGFRKPHSRTLVFLSFSLTLSLHTPTISL